MELDNVIKRIQSCLALAESPAATENEAATALRQAQALMKKYNVSPEAVGRLEIAEDVIICPSAWSKVPQWEISLVNLLCHAFGGQAALRVFPRQKRLAEFTIYTLKHQIPAIVYAYGVLRRQVLAARTKYQKAHCVGMSRGAKIIAGESFCQGFVVRVRSQVEAYAPEQKHAEEMARRLQEATHGRVHKAKAQRYNWHAVDAGKAAGAKASLFRPVGGGK